MAAAVKVKVMTDGATFAKALARGGAGRKNNPLDNKFMGTYMQSIPAMLTILVQPVTYRIEIGIIAGLFTWIFMMVFSLRITLWMPRVWKCMPKVMQKFVADQYLQPYEKEQLADLGYTSDGGSSTKEGAETTSSA